MARKKKTEISHDDDYNVEISGAGIVVEQPVVETLRENFMPYAMSVIVSRALPEIDGFKPSHRKLLYTMYMMGLLKGARTKSANVVGQTMKLNPHGDMAIYETMVRLARGNESLLHPYVDSKGNFGKSYSRDMAFAASRYTEVKLAPICEQLFSEIQKDTVDFVDNYDNTVKEPTLFPVTFPSILVNSNIGIAVGMASAICPFNLAEVCETAVALLKNPDHDLLSTLKAPDFPGGGFLIYEEDVLRDIYDTGRGSVRIRSRYTVDEKEHRIEVTEIPPSTTIEAIIDKVTELVKQGKLRELSDMRDESDKSGLRLAFDYKRGVDGEALMQKLFKSTPLEDSFACNFTVLVNGYPKLMGVREILTEWIAFRRGCIARRTKFELKGKSDRLHILEGLSKILLDIDKAVKIVRETEVEREVVPNLMIGFGIDEIQAEYIAEIKLRHLNREYILGRLEEIEELRAAIAELRAILSEGGRIDRVIMSEQAEVARKYVQPRRTRILYEVEELPDEGREELPDYPVTVFFTREGYFKKITPASLRMNSEQKLKDGDSVILEAECRNNAHLLFFTNQKQVYKARPNDFADCKASVIGDYVAGTLEMSEGEVPIALAVTPDYEGNLLFFYKNGKLGKVPLKAYETKGNRKKLQNAYNNNSEPAAIIQAADEAEYAVFSSDGRMLLVNSALVMPKQAKNTVGVAVMTLKKAAMVERVAPARSLMISDPHRFRSRNLPAQGALVRIGDILEGPPEPENEENEE